MPEIAPPLFVICFVVCIFASSMATYRLGYLNKTFSKQITNLRDVRDIEVIQMEEIMDSPVNEEQKIEAPTVTNLDPRFHEQTMAQAKMVYDMEELYRMNPDTVGWLKVDGMNIDYPVMQTMEQEDYYLDKDFQGNYSANGCLILDTDSAAGTGTMANYYADGSLPTTNLIIHGHNMKSGAMFGSLDKYRNEAFEKEHNIISFSTLYEDRKYEIVSVFLSQVYEKTNTDVFKYYKFFQANTQEEFDDFYNNIKALALYDTGVEAKFGDEFITLSVCAYHVENGRLVVVARRINDDMGAFEDGAEESRQYTETE